MNKYTVLSQQLFSINEFSIVPIRLEDRYDIMKWRNEQIYHLRQNKLLTKEDQDTYFETIVSKLFDQEKPSQILFSFLKEDKCIGYGGLVHINWIDQNAEISFIMDTTLEKEYFSFYWQTYLELIEKLAFDELQLHKIYTYAFDLRPHLYEVLLACGFQEQGRLKEHCLFNNQAIDVLIHGKINRNKILIEATENDLQLTYKWASDERVRKFSYNTNAISFEEHSEWFIGKLSDNNCFYWTLKYGAQKVGSIRIDLKNEKKEGIISYLLDPNFHGIGLGKELLKLVEPEILKKAEIDQITLKGSVFNANLASIKIFESLGYGEMEKTSNETVFAKKITK
jgi:RimJ/RimL family protein N-acetyltransferase